MLSFSVFAPHNPFSSVRTSLYPPATHSSPCLHTSKRAFADPFKRKHCALLQKQGGKARCGLKRRDCAGQTQRMITWCFTDCQLLCDLPFERMRPKSFVCRTKKYSAVSGRSIFSLARTDRLGRHTPSSRSRDSWRPLRFRTSSGCDIQILPLSSASPS